MAAALSVFQTKGVGAATMRDIAEEAGFAVGGLYRYFKNKEEIVNAAADDVAERSIEAWAQTRGENEGFRDYMARVLLAQMEIFSKERALYDVFAQERSEEVLRPVGISSEHSTRWTAALDRLLDEGMKEGSIQPRALDSLTLYVQGALRSALFVYAERNDETVDQVVDDLMSYLFEGIG